MVYEIQKGIPAPDKMKNSLKYPFKQMEIGDSFFVPHARIVTMSVAGRDHRPKKFTCRTITENDIKGVRVWRIE